MYCRECGQLISNESPKCTNCGTGKGLGGWNCRHSYFPFFPGISERAYSDEKLKNIDPEPFEYNGKTYTYYEALLRQRQIENTIEIKKENL